MTIENWIGSPAVRVATAAFAASSIFLWIVASGPLALLAVLVTVLAVICLIFSFRRLYSGWMVFAGILQKVVVGVLFGLCYALIVPLFWLVLRNADPLGLRSRSAHVDSFWRKRNPDETSADSYARMG
jgi:hypothetical protein